MTPEMLAILSLVMGGGQHAARAQAQVAAMNATAARCEKPCRRCRARAGESCKNRMGQFLTSTHRERA